MVFSQSDCSKTTALAVEWFVLLGFVAEFRDQCFQDGRRRANGFFYAALLVKILLKWLKRDNALGLSMLREKPTATSAVRYMGGSVIY